MILSTILKPPEAPSEERPPAASPRHGPLEAYRRRSRRYDRALAIGVVVSVLAHVVFVLMSRALVAYLQPNYAVLPAGEPRRIRAEGTEVVEILPTETVEVEPERVPEPQPEPTAPAVEGEPEATPTLSTAERLRPRAGDLRLWLIPTILPSRLDMTPKERAEELRDRLYALIEARNDSLAAALAAEAERMDWTVGEEGNKWGVSPGQIHLGPITLPLPFYFGPTREDAVTAEEWAEIQRQAGQGNIDETFEERVRAIRERKAREEAQRDTSGGG
ncbi:MAG: hypothetical protein GWN99_05990 [Gemmatimonadetes bacterium]|uniref:Uncharacterized protein n=1 Tax=Candidatus Kutchimonas denitrificans TaxID=3056748 RepID=A0AAE5CCM6_9BACT|nr:hypothetical protein [Gemmatimonadota bacterium]NIR76173.1 hypothetical protein [Candidatus Kutchimonas denitrificans]NIS00613.1 hypothetical protein [Gemmatimonadota bacterium]NIT66758.1 hypothetical protein [Gemmatimonadota bacterium]NIV23357.1 hypothetical protein [Gemmatimonadota bacterium]